MAKIYSNLMRPLLDRLGTAAAAWLVAAGTDAELATQLVNATVALLLVAVDLTLDWRSRRYGRAV